MYPSIQYNCFLIRAGQGWRDGHREDAIADLDHALDLAEQIRSQGAGTEQERANIFSDYREAFEKMIAWQRELQNAAAVLNTMERGRARSFLDELKVAGRDLNAGRSAVERDLYRRREGELHSRIATLEKQLEKVTDEVLRQRLSDDLDSGRRALRQHYTDQRLNSPVYRDLLAVGGGPARMGQVQKQLLADGGLFVSYWLGESESFALLISAKSWRRSADGGHGGCKAIKP